MADWHLHVRRFRPLRAATDGACGIAVVFAVLFGSVFAAMGADRVRIADVVQARKPELIPTLLRQGDDVNAPQADGTTAIHWAAHWDDVAAAETLLRAGANPQAVNRYGRTALSLACENGSARMVDLLLRAGANPNVASAGEPPIMTASRTGNSEAVQALIASGADVNARETWKEQTSLMWAALENHAAVVQLLLAHGADANARSRAGVTPLLLAARQGALDAARALVAGGADVNGLLTRRPTRDRAEAERTGTGALLVAINNLNFELGAFLLAHGANPNARDESGATPLHAIVRARNPSANGMLRSGAGGVDSLALMKALLEAGANPNARTFPETGRFSQEKDLLIDIGVNLGGATPFLLAAKKADMPAMRLLIAAGADAAVPTLEHTTPLMVTAGVGYVEGNDGGMRTADEVLGALAFMLELGADVNAANDHGQTALHGSVYRAMNGVIEFLVKNRARLDASDEVGRTPLRLAEEGYYLMGHVSRDEQAVVLRTLGTAR